VCTFYTQVRSKHDYLLSELKHYKQCTATLEEALKKKENDDKIITNNKDSQKTQENQNAIIREVTDKENFVSICIHTYVYV